MKGWKTLIINVLSVVGTLLALRGIEFTPEQQAQVATGAVTLIGLLNVIVRNFTDSRPGWHKPGAPPHIPMALLAILSTTILTGCGTNAQQFIQAISLDPCEIGYVDVSGTVNLGGNPLISSDVYVEIREEHTRETIPKNCPGYVETVGDPLLDS